jgi:5'-3' exonuclease
MDRYSKRTVRATKQHSQDCKDLLTLMGVPIVDVRSSPISEVFSNPKKVQIQTFYFEPRTALLRKLSG